MNTNKQPDWDEVAAHEAGKGECFPCFFCDTETNGNYASPPEGSSRAIRDLYLARPRCMACDLEIRTRLNEAMIKGIESVFAHIPKSEERSEDEKQALDEIYAGQDREALSAADVDRLAEEKADGRFWN